MAPRKLVDAAAAHHHDGRVRTGARRQEQRAHDAAGADGVEAGQEIHGGLDRRCASFETAAFAASSG
jgi:hypothetical protein